MSLLTINKLTASVGAEVDGHRSRSTRRRPTCWPTRCSTRWKTTGCSSFRGLNLNPEAQVAFCRRLGDVDTPPTATTRWPGSTRSPSTRRRTRRRRTCAPPSTGTSTAAPRLATNARRRPPCSRQSRSPNAAARPIRQHLRRLRRVSSDDEKQALRVVAGRPFPEASQRRVTPIPHPEQLARWRARRTHEHPLVWTHQNGRKSLVLGASADHIAGMDHRRGPRAASRTPGPRHRARNWSTAITGRSATR